MRVLRKVIGVVAAVLYVLVVLFLTINTWQEYAGGARSLSAAISQTILLVGLPFLVLAGFALPEAVFHTLRWLSRKVLGPGAGGSGP